MEKNLFKVFTNLLKRFIPGKVNGMITLLKSSQLSVLNKDFENGIRYLILAEKQFRSKITSPFSIEIVKYIDDSKYLQFVANYFFESKRWREAQDIWNFLYLNGEKDFKIILGLSITHQILGDKNNANKYMDYCLSNYKDELNEMNTDRRLKVILYDNGESKIELYKKLKPNITEVVVTFDSISILSEDNPFGYSFLKNLDVDIIAVRHKSVNNFHQDLSYELFNEIVSIVLSVYEHKVAYGFSLGGYSALYYCGHLCNEIIALSPRNPAHPKYGDKQTIQNAEFTHDLTIRGNEHISPIVIYDPKNQMDNMYVESVVVQSFPKATLIKLHYVGHLTAKYLVEVRLLKELVTSIIQNKNIPDLRSKRSESLIYLKNLFNVCINKNKLNFALVVAKRAVKQFPENHDAILLQANVLVALNRLEEAIAVAEYGLSFEPTSEKLRDIIQKKVIKNV